MEWRCEKCSWKTFTHFKQNYIWMWWRHGEGESAAWSSSQPRAQCRSVFHPRGRLRSQIRDFCISLPSSPLPRDASSYVGGLEAGDSSRCQNSPWRERRHPGSGWHVRWSFCSRASTTAVLRTSVVFTQGLHSLVPWRRYPCGGVGCKGTSFLPLRTSHAEGHDAAFGVRASITCLLVWASRHTRREGLQCGNPRWFYLEFSEYW